MGEENNIHCIRCHSEDGTEDLSLCSGCRQMRIPHLVRCIKTGEAEERPDTEWVFSYNELQDRASTCRFCHFLRNMLYSHHNTAGLEEPDMSNIAIELWVNNGKFIWISVTKGGRRLGPATLDVLVPPHQLNISSLPPSLEPRVDWGVVNTWFQWAKVEEVQDSRWPINMKVIDIYQDRLVKAPAKCPYIALSYVWGNIDRVPVEESGVFDRHCFSATLRDAIVACTNMGVQYLWIDQVCINQNDPKEVSQQVKQMDRIYQHATCTLVALAGKDSSYGLPGVTSPRRWNFSKCEVGPIIFVDQAPGLSQCFNESQWATRGWTLQEFLFSSRLLLFTEYGTYYAYRTSTGLGINSEVNSLPSNLKDIPSPDRHWSILEQYTTRNLRYDSDILPAFSGALQSAYGDDTYYGMPVHHIDQAVAWSAINGESTLNELRHGYPSWSWTSHCGPIRHVDVHGGLAVWATLVPESGTAINICKPARGSEWGADLSGMEYVQKDRFLIERLIGPWLAGCIQIPSPDIQCVECCIDSLVARWPTYDAFWHEAFAWDQNGNIFSQEDIRAAASPNSGRILVHSQIAHFQIGPSKRSANSRKDYPLWIYSRDGSFAGAIHIPTYKQDFPTGSGWGEFVVLSVGNGYGLTGILHDKSIDPGDITGCHCRRVFPKDSGQNQQATQHINSCPLSGDEPDEDTAHDRVRTHYLEEMRVPYPSNYKWSCQSHPREQFNNQSWEVLNVLLIQRNQHTNVARRCGLGKIFLRKWAEASPQFKTVILE